jgi:aryl-alcohol dehydrogenase-like predicted oxidoreductase
MDRRRFLKVSSLACGGGLRLLAETPMPMTTLGKTGLRVSRIAMGGWDMSRSSVESGAGLIQRAIELGINFFDSAHTYNEGRSDQAYGKAIDKARRQKVLLMSKSRSRTAEAAMRDIEDTLRKMNTDYLDLWQCHTVSTPEDIDQILAPKGALEAFVKAKEQGKVRHIGFTGHQDPAVHARLLDSFDGWETIQHPVNLVDPHYESFVRGVLPKARAKGLGCLAMKTNAMGGITNKKVATIEECLRFAWSQPVDVVVSGMQTVEQLEQNALACKTFTKMTDKEIADLLARTAKGPVGVEVEKYKKAPRGAAAHRPHEDGEYA